MKKEELRCWCMEKMTEENKIILYPYKQVGAKEEVKTREEMIHSIRAYAHHLQPNLNKPALGQKVAQTATKSSSSNSAAGGSGTGIQSRVPPREPEKFLRVLSGVPPS